jgi:TldD protein
MFDQVKILKALMRGNGLYGDIFSEKRTYTHIHLESERIEKLERGTDQGVGLRLINPWKMYFASTSNIEEGNLLDLATNLSKFSREKSETQTKTENHVDTAYPFAIILDPEEVNIETKIKMVKNVESMAKSMEPRIRQVRVIYRDTRQKVKIYSSDGKDLSDNRTQVVLNLLLVGEEKGEMQTAYEAIGGFYGYDLFSEEAIESLVSKTVKRLAGLLAAREAPMGTKTVVLSSEAGGTMIHEAIGHGLEADLAMEGLSCYKGMLGESIASPLITL